MGHVRIMVKTKRNKPAYTYTFSGWLKFVKELSEKEASGLFDDREKWDELQQEYEEYMIAEDERLAELEEKAVRRKKKGRRTNKGTFHGKSRGKHVGKDY